MIVLAIIKEQPTLISTLAYHANLIAGKILVKWLSPVLGSLIINSNILFLISSKSKEGKILKSILPFQPQLLSFFREKIYPGLNM